MLFLMPNQQCQSKWSSESNRPQWLQQAPLRTCTVWHPGRRASPSLSPCRRNATATCHPRRCQEPHSLHPSTTGITTHVSEFESEFECCRNSTILGRSKMRLIYRLVYVGFGLIIHRRPSFATQKQTNSHWTAISWCLYNTKRRTEPGCRTTWCSVYRHRHTDTGLTALFPGQPRWAGTRKVNQSGFYWSKRHSGSDISWAICKSAPRSRQITMPAPHQSVFLQAGCPSCRPTNSVKALKAVFSIYRHR